MINKANKIIGKLINNITVVALLKYHTQKHSDHADNLFMRITLIHTIDFCS